MPKHCPFLVASSADVNTLCMKEECAIFGEKDCAFQKLDSLAKSLYILSRIEQQEQEEEKKAKRRKLRRKRRKRKLRREKR